MACASNEAFAAADTNKPNIIFLLTDDIGYGDVAEEGTKFTQFYAAAPVCSPSRTGFLTGMYPGRWRITNFLQTRAGNRASEQADFLDPKAPSIARTLKQAGYVTAHFGKWHMGGGRDKIKRWDRSAYFVDRTLDFLRRHKGEPCYVNLWPDDVHTPWIPAGTDIDKRRRENDESAPNFKAVLLEYDKQVGRLIAGLKELGIETNTILIFSSDNGPLPTFRGRRAGGMRGSKDSLYEGGTRMPLIVRWPGHVPAGRVDETTVMHGVDFFPMFCKLAGVSLPEQEHFDGEDMSKAFLGTASVRQHLLFWEYGRNPTFGYPRGRDRSPNVAVREGKWKALVNADGSSIELYDLDADRNETQNIANENPEIAKRMTEAALQWRKSLP